MSFHVPVMTAAVVEQLVVDPAATYVDATAGGGGHSAAILGALSPAGRLLALDRDPEAVAEARIRLASFGDRVHVEHAEFGELAARCRALSLRSVRGVLFDLGVSSRQLDAPERGFSFRTSGPLDMRMDSGQKDDAGAWLAAATQEEIARTIHAYGEERGATRIARSIVHRRASQGLRTTADLREAVLATRPAHPPKTLARVFQAIRIAINDELRQLERGLDAVAALLEPGGRLVVLAYQSGEDRVVKGKLGPLVRGCTCPPEAPLCTCGGRPSFRRVLRRPLRAAAAEVVANPRARSARLRVYEKLRGEDNAQA